MKLFIGVTIVIQHPKNKSFLNAQKAWSEHLEEALRFNNSVEAEMFCKKERLGKVFILIRTTRGADVKLPFNGD